MLPSKNRVKRGENKKSASNRRIFRGSIVTISVVPPTINKRQDFVKVAIVITKKTIKSAASRNRLKRRVYSIIKEHVPHMASGVYTIYIKKESKETPYKRLKEDIENVLKKIQ